MIDFNQISILNIASFFTVIALPSVWREVFRFLPIIIYMDITYGGREAIFLNLLNYINIELHGAIKMFEMFAVNASGTIIHK